MNNFEIGDTVRVSAADYHNFPEGTVATVVRVVEYPSSARRYWVAGPWDGIQLEQIVRPVDMVHVVLLVDRVRAMLQQRGLSADESNRAVRNADDRGSLRSILRGCTLGGAFIWHFTPEGHDYWSRINRKYFD